MITYLVWWYAQEPAYLWRAVNVTSNKILNLFSVPILIRTLFDPWKRDVTYVENASLDVRYKVWLNNLISRLVGFVVRLITALTGILFATLAFLVLAAFFLVWLALPIIIIFLLFNGLKTILNG